MRGLSKLSALVVMCFCLNAFGGAKEHFINGQEYYDQARYKDAIDEFEKAYELDAKPLLLYNIAQAYEKLGQLTKSVEYLKRFLQSGSTKVDTKMVKSKVTNLEARIQQTGISVEVSEEGADIYVDDRKVGTSPAGSIIPLDEGMHKVRIVKQGFRDFTMNVGVVVGHSVPVDAKLEVADASYVSEAPVTAAPVETEAAPVEGPVSDEPPTEAETDEAPEEDGVKALDVVPWVVTGVGAATAVAGWAAFGIPANKDGDTDKARLADIVGFVGVGIAVGGAVWGIVRLVKKKKKSGESSVSMTVMPLAGDHTAGAAASISF